MNDHLDALYGNLNFAMEDMGYALSCCHDFWASLHSDEDGEEGPHADAVNHAHAALAKAREYIREAMKPLEPFLNPLDG